MMPRRKDISVIEVTWGSDRLCVKTVKDQVEKYLIHDLKSVTVVFALRI